MIKGYCSLKAKQKNMWQRGCDQALAVGRELAGDTLRLSPMFNHQPIYICVCVFAEGKERK